MQARADDIETRCTGACEECCECLTEWNARVISWMLGFVCSILPMNEWSYFVRLFEELIFVVHAALPSVQVPATNSSRNLELHAKIMSYKLCNYAAWQRVEASVNLNSMNVSERLLVARHKDDSFAKWDPQKAVRKRVFRSSWGKNERRRITII